MISLYALLRKELDNTMLLATLLAAVGFYLTIHDYINVFSYVFKHLDHPGLAKFD